jgi:hypothetical protein
VGEVGEVDEIMKALNSSEFKVLFENKLIDEIGVRNFLIRREYQNAKGRWGQVEFVKHRLAEETHLSNPSLTRILYNPYKKKSVFSSFAELEKKIRE